MLAAGFSDRKRYYTILFPQLLEAGWLRLATCDGLYPLSRVEIAPRWIRADGENVMLRSMRFASAAELAAFCVERKPHTLQLGGVLPPVEEADQRKMIRKGSVASAFGPLVFDIDANDYPERHQICACGVQHTVCQRCWTALIEPARRVIHYLLEDVFYLGQRIDTFSGRRGLHSWCYDRRVLRWTREQRTAFMARIGADAMCVSAEHGAAIEALLRKHVPRALGTDDMDRAQLFERFYPRFDVAVSADASHLKGCILSMHHDTRFLRVPLPPLEANYAFKLTRHCIRPEDMSAEAVRVLLQGVLATVFKE
jgi:DNA primase catalytic subunit